MYAGRWQRHSRLKIGFLRSHKNEQELFILQTLKLIFFTAFVEVLFGLHEIVKM